MAAGVVQLQLGAVQEHEQSQPQFQWAVKQRHLFATWQGRHFPQTGLQPQSDAAVVHVGTLQVGALQVGAVQLQELLPPHESQQPWLKILAKAPRTGAQPQATGSPLQLAQPTCFITCGWHRLGF